MKRYFKHVSTFLSVYAYFVFLKIAVDLFLYIFYKQSMAQLVLPSLCWLHRIFALIMLVL